MIHLQGLCHLSIFFNHGVFNCPRFLVVLVCAFSSHKIASLFLRSRRYTYVSKASRLFRRNKLAISCAKSYKIKVPPPAAAQQRLKILFRVRRGFHNELDNAPHTRENMHPHCEIMHITHKSRLNSFSSHFII